MSVFVIDEEKCKKDGICAATCPTMVIEQKEKASLPTMIEGGEEMCINCGHCMAVCPEQALSLKTMPPEQCPPIRKDWLLSPEQAEHFLRNRRSIRVYKKEPVDKETINRLIEIARYASSGHNAQPVHWHVIWDSDKVHEIAGSIVEWLRTLFEGDFKTFAEEMRLDRAIAYWEKGVDVICRGAPHLIIAHGPEADIMAQGASFIALTYLELAAPSFGLGTCWDGMVDMAAMFGAPTMDLIGLPEGHKLCGSMLIGHPKFKYHRFPMRNEPKLTWG